MKLGFTGTRCGHPAPQQDSLKALLKSFQRDSLAMECHHGDCVGADSEFADLCAEVYRCLAHIVCHPPVDEGLRAFNTKANETRPALTHFARNRAIVDETVALVACPAEMEHQSHGGAWYTVDYAKKRGKPVYLVLPDGSVQPPADPA